MDCYNKMKNKRKTKIQITKRNKFVLNINNYDKKIII